MRMTVPETAMAVAVAARAIPWLLIREDMLPACNLSQMERRGEERIM